MRMSCFRFSRILLVSCFLLSCLLVGREAGALGVQDRAQVRCIKALNRDLCKVALRQDIEVSRCIRDVADGGLGSMSVGECVAADRRGRVQSATSKTLEHENRRCSAPRPSFGATNGATVNDVATRQSMDLIQDILGPDFHASTAADLSDTATTNCRRYVPRAAARCLETRLREFNKCKRRGLKYFDEVGDLAACISQSPTRAIARRCDDSLGRDSIHRAITTRCVAGGVGLAQAFPGCNTDDPEGLHSCLARAAACRACLALQEADGLGDAVDCDLEDDNIANGSCPGPVGLEIGEQQCVLDNASHVGEGWYEWLLPSLRIDCERFSPFSEQTSCMCTLPEPSVHWIPGLDYLCMEPLPALCPPGEIDCGAGGELRCHLGLRLTREAELPCGDGDALQLWSDACIPVTTETASGGSPVECAELAAGRMSGLSLVGETSVPASLGNWRIGIEATCE